LDLVVTLGRAKVYAALSKTFYHLFYGESVPGDCKAVLKNFGEIDVSLNSETVRGLRGSLLIKNMPKPLSEVYSEVIKDFYEANGFEASELPADHIAVELAFLSKLVEKEITAMQQRDEEKLYKIRAVEHRFIKTHLQPLVEFSPSSPLLNFLREFVREDAKLLYSQLVEVKDGRAHNH